VWSGINSVAATLTTAVAVKGGAQDCPYTYMRDLADGKYRLPWEDEVQVTDGTSCGFAIPNRT
jgi:formamidase